MSDTGTPSRRLLYWGGCAAALIVHASLLVWSATRNSVAFDEYAHLPAGVACWKHHDFSIYNLSPPLLRLLATWPAVLAGADAPPASSYRKYDPRQRHWIYAEAFLRANFHRYHRLFVLSRAALIPWSCLGGLIVFLWARQLYGPIAAGAALWVYALEPNILAHASLVGTDAGTATAMLAAAWLWDRFCVMPHPRRALLAAFAIAAAIGCKFTALLILPVIAAIAVFRCIHLPAQRRAILLGGTSTAILVMVLMNLLYGYDKSFQRLGRYEFQSSTMLWLQKHLPGATPLPLPRQFVIGFDTQKFESELPVPAFALGQRFDGSRWWYYPLVLASKLPIALWMLAILALLRRGFARDELPPLVLIAIFVAGVAVLGNVDIGIRYILPIVPPMIVLLARAWIGARWMRMASWMMLGVLALETLASAPRFLTFFNAAVGGPTRGQFIINDSNFDWGQELLDLRDWMRDNDVSRIGLAYFGRVDPGVYGIKYTPLVEGGEESLVGVSSYYLMGMPHRLPTPHGPTDYTSLPYYRQLQRKRPIAVVGRVMYIFRREDLEAAQRE